MKKIIALVLALIMLLCVFTACKKDEDEDTTGTVSTDNTPDDGLPNVDMEGFELGLLGYNDEWFTWAEITLAVEDYTAGMIPEAIYKRNVAIEDRFNCVLNVKTEKGIDRAYIETLSMAGDTGSDIHVVMYYDKWVISASPYFADWDSVDYIDLSQDYWNQGITEMFDINDKQIAISGVFSLGMLSRTETILFDKQKYAEFAAIDDSLYDTMYEYVEKDEWTLDKLYEIAAMAVEGDDETWDENDHYGISASKKELYTSLMVGSGVRFIEPDKEGTPKFTLTSNQTYFEKLDKLLQINKNNDIHYDKSTNAHYPDPEDFFEKGHTLFAVRSIFDIPEARQTMTSEFGILPIPKYDTEQTEYYSACFGGDVACLMNTVTEDKLENIGIIMEALTFHSQNNLIPTYKTDLLQSRYASDVDSAKMLDIIFESTCSDMGITVLEDEVSFYLISQVYSSGKELSSELATMDFSIPGKLKKILNGEQ